MSSNPSVTVRDGSGEPSAKRQKAFHYGPDIVFLQAFDKNVAHVPGVRYREVCNTIGLEFGPTTTKCIDGVKIEQVKLFQDESVVQFYAHWINERDVEAALEVCRPENITWPTFACRLLRLWHDEGLHNDMHDSVIDCIIERLRSRRRRRWAPAVLINALYCSVEAIERESLIGTNFTLHTKLRDLLATLYLHHLKEKLMSQERISIKERRLLNLKDDIRIVAMSLLLDAATEEDFKLPKDILADDFHQHCRYHVHGTNERCYRQKQS